MLLPQIVDAAGAIKCFNEPAPPMKRRGFDRNCPEPVHPKLK
jgi:hypothetical protein